MCGRYSLNATPGDLGRVFGFRNLPNLRPRYNIAPTQEAPVVRARDGDRRLDTMRWGLVPPWARDASGAARSINARAETIAEKPSFRAAFRARRCLVPADGFYEWEVRGRERRPWRVFLDGGAPFAFAGIWEGRAGATAGAPPETFAIATTAAAAPIAHIHRRMPVILRGAAFDAWLHAPPGEALALLRPLDGGLLRFHPVAPRVGDVRNDDPGLLEPWEERQASLF